MTHSINSLLFFLFIAAPFSDAKATQIKSTNNIPSGIITLVEGETIFANGAMQAKVRVVLNDKNLDISNYDIKLKEYATGTDLSSLGWTVNTTDLGFDHSFNAVSSYKDQSSKLSDNALKNYADLFISTTNENARIIICFEIDNKEKTTLFSSCHDHGIDRGTVEIYAARPYRFSIADFEETPKVKIFHVGTNKQKSTLNPITSFKNELIGFSYGLKAKPSVPREFRFTFINPEKNDKYKLITKDFDADRRNAYIRTAGFGDISYLERYLFMPQKKGVPLIQNSLNFSVYNISAQKKGTYAVFPTAEEHIIHMLEVHYFNHSFMLEDMHCYDPDPAKPETKYTCYKTDSSETSYFTLNKDESTWDQMYNQYGVEVKLQDNFGTTHSIKLESYQE